MLDSRRKLLAVLILAFTARSAAGQDHPRGSAGIAGRIVRAGTTEPIARALVTIRPAGQAAPGISSASTSQPTLQGQTRRQQTVSTGTEGQYVFTNLGPGQYRITVERDGYIRQEFGQRTWDGPGTVIDVAPGQSLADIDFAMVLAGAIAGRIVDENGDVLAGIQVRALSRVYQDGKPALVQTRQVQTNDRGEYRLYWLGPGEYFVSALPNARLERVVQSAPSRSEDVSYAPSYYPGGIDPDGAVPVRVGAASEVGGIVFMLPPTRTVQITGTVISPFAGADSSAGQRAGRIQVAMTRETRNPGAAGLGGGIVGSQFLASASSSGAFKIDGVIPGTYLVTAIQRIDDRMFSARTRVYVGGAVIENFNLTLEAPAIVAGQINVDDAAAPPDFRLDGVRVSLVPVDDLQADYPNAEAGKDGSFVLNNVAPIAYRVRIEGLPAGGYLLAGRYGAADALSAPLQIQNQGVSLHLQVGFSPGHVVGVVTDNTGNPYPGVTCVLVPSERYRTDLHQTSSTDQYGRFSFSNIPPGEYKVFAWENLPAGAHLDPAFVARFDNRGPALRVEKNSTASIRVPVIRENDP